MTSNIFTERVLQLEEARHERRQNKLHCLVLSIMIVGSLLALLWTGYILFREESNGRCCLSQKNLRGKGRLVVKTNTGYFGSVKDDMNLDPMVKSFKVCTSTLHKDFDFSIMLVPSAISGRRRYKRDYASYMELKLASSFPPARVQDYSFSTCINPQFGCMFSKDRVETDYVFNQFKMARALGRSGSAKCLAKDYNSCQPEFTRLGHNFTVNQKLQLSIDTVPLPLVNNESQVEDSGPNAAAYTLVRLQPNTDPRFVYSITASEKHENRTRISWEEFKNSCKNANGMCNAQYHRLNFTHWFQRPYNSIPALSLKVEKGLLVMVSHFSRGFETLHNCTEPDVWHRNAVRTVCEGGHAGFEQHLRLRKADVIEAAGKDGFLDISITVSYPPNDPRCYVKIQGDIYFSFNAICGRPDDRQMSSWMPYFLVGPVLESLNMHKRLPPRVLNFRKIQFQTWQDGEN